MLSILIGSSSIVLMKLFTNREKTSKSNWQKIEVIPIYENGDGKRINTENIKEPKLTK